MSEKLGSLLRLPSRAQRQAYFAQESLETRGRVVYTRQFIAQNTIERFKDGPDLSPNNDTSFGNLFHSEN